MIPEGWHELRVKNILQREGPTKDILVAVLCESVRSTCLKRGEEVGYVMMMSNLLAIPTMRSIADAINDAKAFQVLGRAAERQAYVTHGKEVAEDADRCKERVKEIGDSAAALDSIVYVNAWKVRTRPIAGQFSREIVIPTWEFKRTEGK